MMDKELLLKNYAEVQSQIIQTSHVAQRHPDEIKLIVVSKFQPETKIHWLLDAGQRQFAESRIEEIEQKWPSLLMQYPDVVLHYIGQIQSRKIKNIIKYCHYIHSLDRLEIAEKIAVESIRQQRSPICLVQINTGAEHQKNGISPEAFPDFYSACKNITALNIQGIMCIPPVHENPLPHFALMQKIKNSFSLAELSMGMSSDYREAILHGATMLRIGTRIMGERT